MNQEDSVKASDLEELFQPTGSPVNLLEHLLPITESFISATCKSQTERDLDIIKKRFGLNHESVYSLEEIGIYYNITRERVRQIEFKIISTLSELIYGSRESKKFKIQENFVLEYKRIKDRLINFDYILTEEETKKFFQDRYGINKESEAFSSLSFLMELLGYCSISAKTNRYRGAAKSAWCQKEKFNKAHAERVFSYFNTLLDRSEKFKFFDIVISLNKTKGNRLDKDFIRMLLKLCIEIEKDEDEDEDEDEAYQVKFECLPSAAERAFRVLQEKGDPLHFSEIAKIINHAELNLGKGKRITVANLKNQLIVDGRFKPIGRSGIWSLSTWDNIATKTITQIMEDSFHEGGKPLSAKEVYQYVITKRPDASSRSVSTYLSNTDVFVRVDKNQYALVVWGLKSLNKSIRRTADEASSLVNTALKEIFIDKDSIHLADLIRLIQEKTQLAEMTIRKKIKDSQNFELKQEGNSNSYTVHCLNRDFEQVSSPLEFRKELLRDKIQNEIISILQANPNEPITKGDLYFQVRKEVDCLRPTFYAYLSNMKDVEQYTENGKSYCLFEYHEQKNSVDIDSALLTTCSDLELLNRLKRAISKLNVDEVDLGLFELGRIFENELKDYLVIAKQHSVIQIYRKDLEKLVYMIDCVVRENVVSKGYYLHILREERNERAHGKIPNLDERKTILNKAHYIAELYIQNIIFFNDQKNKILAQIKNVSMT
jgi:Sigma-70, region 4/HB1, ASXL, restriction endonuclease HTH domain